MAYESGLAIAQGRYQLGNYIAAMSEAMLTLDLKPGTFLHARYGFVLLVSPVCVAVWLWVCGCGCVHALCFRLAYVHHAHHACTRPQHNWQGQCRAFGTPHISSPCSVDVVRQLPVRHGPRSRSRAAAHPAVAAGRLRGLGATSTRRVHGCGFTGAGAVRW